MKYTKEIMENLKLKAHFAIDGILPLLIGNKLQ